MEVLSATVYGEEIEKGRVMSSAIGDIDLNEAVSAEHLGLGITRYTFKLETNEPYVFKNLILRKNQEDRFSGYIITYYPDLEWLAQNEGQLEMISFTGNILFSSLQEKPIYWVVVNNGEGTVFSPKIASYKDGRIDCGGGSSPSGSGGSGPNHAGFWNSWVPTGGGSFDYAPYFPLGGSGGGVVTLYIEVYKAEKPPADWLARTACDSGSPESFCPSDTSPDAVEGDANCPSNPIGVLDGDLSDYLADVWEEEVCLKENFSNNDCINGI
ncbi:MAG: hypothetical protein AAGI25_20710 [Bacteroidota bacterium]